MGIKKPTTKVFTDYRRVRKDGKYAIKLRVTYKGKSHEYALGLFVSSEEDKVLQAGKFGRNDHLKRINRISVDQLSRANSIIDTIPVFSPNAFEKEFLKEDGSEQGKYTNTLYQLLTKRSEIVRRGGSESYAVSFQTTANVIKEYSYKTTLQDIDVDYLKKLEDHLIEKDVSSGSVGVYMRNIRTIYNVAIEEGLISKINYPFGKKRYSIPQQRNNKTAIGISEVMRIISYNAVENSSIEKARDFWVFMYLTNGLNMKDVCLLKRNDLKNNLDGLNFFRAKTKRSTKHNKIEIDVWYDEYSKPIIEKTLSKYGNSNTENDAFLFPILYKGVNPKDERRLIQNFTRFVNKNMAKLSKILDLSSIPNTNVARHTFVTRIINSGNAPITAVKDMVGHTSVNTTAGYVNSLPIDSKKGYAACLVEKD